MRYDAPPPRQRAGRTGGRADAPPAEAWTFGGEPRGRERSRDRARERAHRSTRSSRARWAVGGTAAVALIACVAVGAWAGAPAIVRARLQTRLAEVGLEGDVENVALGTDGVHLENVAIRLPSGRSGLRMTLSRVSIDWAMVSGAGNAVIDGGSVRADLASRDLRGFVSKLRAREARRDSSRAASGGARSTWRAGGIVVALRDAEGDLVRASDVAVERDVRGALRVALRGAELGRGVVSASSVIGARREGGNVDVSVRDATLRLTSSSDLAPVRTLRRRMVAAIDALRPATAASAHHRASSWRFGARDGRVLVGESTLADAITLSAESAGAGAIALRATASAGSAPEAVDVDLTVDPVRETARGNVHLEGLPLAVLAPALPDLPWHHADQSFVRGQVAINTGTDGRSVETEGSLTVTNLGFSSPRLGPRPFAGLDVGISGRATIEPSVGRVDLRDVAISLGRVTVRASGNVRSAGARGWGAELALSMPETRCADAFGALPPAITEDLAGFSVEGTIGATIAVGIDTQNLDATRLEIDFRDRCRAVSGGYFADTTRFRTPFLHRVTEPDGVLREMTLGPGTAEWVPIDRISGFLLHGVLGREDAGFFRHHGFAPTEIRHALVRNLREGRYVYGASTITMQLVKNVFLRREKTLARKIQECLLTWYVEHVMEKGAILELYLNVIEYGPGVYGIGPAAMHYFGRRPDELSPAEAVFLATVLPNPRERHRMWEAGAVTPEWRTVVRRVLQRLYRAHRIDRPAYEHGMRDPITFHRPGDPPVAERDLSHLSWSRLPVGMASPIVRVVATGDSAEGPEDDVGSGVIETGSLAPAPDEGVVDDGALQDDARPPRVARPRADDRQDRLRTTPEPTEEGGWIEEDDTAVDSTDE